MNIQARAYANCDEITIVWRCDATTKDCLGFALHREEQDANGALTETCVETWVGFAGDPSAKPGTHQLSTVWPVQRYVWSDYFAKGSKIRYQVVPMIGTPGALKPSDTVSNWTEWVTLGTGHSAGFNAYFNRGMIASQWVARALAAGTAGSATVLSQGIKSVDSPLRAELGGCLITAMVDLFTKANQAGMTLYAALYELNDPELIALLKTFGKRCNLILGSGAYKAGEKDENEAVRADLKASNTVTVFDRLVGSPHFAHNKFVVFCGADGKPTKLWTGSTNWTVTGLCTQVNNGVEIQDPVIAQVFLDRWNQIKEAGGGYPAELAEAGSAPGRSQFGSVHMTAWNAPVNGLVDLTGCAKADPGGPAGACCS